jgi:ankyrin repeat protein
MGGAAEKGYEEIVELLLKNGADKTIVGQGHTALSFAQSKGHQNIVALLS